MHSKEQLVNEHITEFESRQKHVDELLDTARTQVGNKPEYQDDLTVFDGKRDELTNDLEELKNRSAEEWAAHEIEDAGPMGVWYGLISELEAFIEKLGK